MNEESITNIISYIQQYPDVPTEQLVQNLQNSGYKMKDLKEALHRQGISPIVIPGYVEPDPPPQTPFYTKKVFIIITVIFGVGIIASSAYFIIASSGKIKQTPPVSKNIEPNIIITTKPNITASPSGSLMPVSSTNPLSSMKSALSVGDYKITTTTFIQSDEEATSSSKNIQNSQKRVLYSKKGILERLDVDSSGYVLLKDNKTFFVDSIHKVYTYTDAETFQKAVRVGYFLDGLIQDTDNGTIIWKENVPTMWSGQWNYFTYLGIQSPDTAKHAIKISLDPKTQFVSELWYEVDINTIQKWEVVEYVYEPVTNMESFLEIPPDYKNNSPTSTPLPNNP